MAAEITAKLKDEVFQEYLNTKTSRKKLAQKYDIPESTIISWMRDGGWVEKRKAITQKVSESIQKGVEKKKKKQVTARLKQLENRNAGIDEMLEVLTAKRKAVIKAKGKGSVSYSALVTLTEMELKLYRHLNPLVKEDQMDAMWEQLKDSFKQAKTIEELQEWVAEHQYYVSQSPKAGIAISRRMQLLDMQIKAENKDKVPSESLRLALRMSKSLLIEALDGADQPTQDKFADKYDAMVLELKRTLGM